MTQYRYLQVPDLTASVSPDSASVVAGSPAGLTATVANAASAGLATGVALSVPLPGGLGMSWTIAPTYTGPGSCSVGGSVGSQTLACTIGSLAGGTTASVHVSSATTVATCGSYPVHATISASNEATLTPSTSLTVTCPIVATGIAVTATEGVALSGSVASFSDGTPETTTASYGASIDWGDGSQSSTGSVTGSAGVFGVAGTHTYAEEGSFTVRTTITETAHPTRTASATANASVGDAPLTATGVTVSTPTAFSGVVATFTDANSGAPLGDFSATIDWGDSTPTSTGTIGSGAGQFSVSGAHTYASPGSRTVTVSIHDVGGATATATSALSVSAGPPGGGAFVIGNGSTSGTVTFWSSQWAKSNVLSGGPAAASFRGFASTPATPSCGTTWRTDPGNSAAPPTGPLPQYIAVIVTDSTAKSGSQISGTTLHVVLVRTNPGYDGTVGHTATGVVVGTIC
jgi:hypothetical protein